MEIFKTIASLTMICQPSAHFAVATSKIARAGKGLFSKDFIEKDTILFISFAPKGDNGQTATALEQSAAQMASDEQKEVKSIPVFEARYTQLFPNDFVNHDKEPNCETAVIGDMFLTRSIRNIKPGEELTKDYSHTMKLIQAKGFFLADDFLNF